MPIPKSFIAVQAVTPAQGTMLAWVQSRWSGSLHKTLLSKMRFASGIVAGDTVRYHWPRVAAVSDIRITVVERNGVDFDEHLRCSQREG